MDQDERHVAQGSGPVHVWRFAVDREQYRRYPCRRYRTGEATRHVLGLVGFPINREAYAIDARLVPWQQAQQSAGTDLLGTNRCAGRRGEHRLPAAVIAERRVRMAEARRAYRPVEVGDNREVQCVALGFFDIARVALMILAGIRG